MNHLSITLLVGACLISGCASEETRQRKKAEHLASLNCQSSREGRTQEELQAIGDSCFRAGTFHKSSGRKW